MSIDYFPSDRSGAAMRRRSYLAVMGIECWERRVHEAASIPTPIAPVSTAPIALEPPAPPAAPPKIMSLNWELLEQAVQNCRACPLHRAQSGCNLGKGNRAAQWFMVSEYPHDEDQRAAQLFEQMLGGIGLRREEAYITHLLKSPLAGPRSLAPAEIAACLPYLKNQIELIRPKIIVTIGAGAANNLVTSPAAIETLRGRMHRYGTARIPLVATYSLAYLLRNSQEKRKTWDDLRLAWRIFNRVPPDGHDIENF